MKALKAGDPMATSTFPQTIQIFLPSGDPQGIREAAITTRIIRVFDVPRSALAEFLAMDAANQVGLYFLIGENENSDLPQAYIGQTGSLADRLAQHHKAKDFWNRALVAVSVTNSLTNTHVSFLEWLSIQQAGKAERYVLENGNTGSRPHTPPPLEAECREIHETVRVLLGTLGYPLFDSLTRASEKLIRQGRLYFCTKSEADGRMVYTDEGFVVLKGSTGRRNSTPSFQQHNYFRHRERLIEQGVMSIQGDRVRFERDYLFTSPSLAAVCLMARATNGWYAWKDADGHTLAEIERDAGERSEGDDE
jgi:hypothetical protein